MTAPPLAYLDARRNLAGPSDTDTTDTEGDER